LPNASADSDTEDLTQEDIVKLRSKVRRKSGPILGDADVDDITSSILLDAYEASRKPASTAPLAALCFMYAEYTKYYTRRAYISPFAAGDDDLDQISTPAVVQNNALHVEVRLVIGKLPEEYQQILWHCDFANNTLEEWAASHGGSVATASRTLKKARASFKKEWLA
jgi:DNA-directed RNA polymerase specialized sigma24 family protein